MKKLCVSYVLEFDNAVRAKIKDHPDIIEFYKKTSELIEKHRKSLAKQNEVFTQDEYDRVKDTDEFNNHPVRVALIAASKALNEAYAPYWDVHKKAYAEIHNVPMCPTEPILEVELSHDPLLAAEQIQLIANKIKELANKYGPDVKLSVYMDD